MEEINYVIAVGIMQLLIIVYISYRWNAVIERNIKLFFENTDLKAQCKKLSMPPEKQASEMLDDVVKEEKLSYFYEKAYEDRCYIFGGAGWPMGKARTEGFTFSSDGYYPKAKLVKDIVKAHLKLVYLHGRKL